MDVIAAGAPVDSDCGGDVHACGGGQHEAAGAAGAGTAARRSDRRSARLRGGTSLDRAFIGTIHAFCAQLLRRRPVEAGVDPVFQELAQPDALRVFGGVFRRWIEQRLASPSPALSRALARLAWRAIARRHRRSIDCETAAWALAEWRDFDAPWEQARVRSRRAADGAARARRRRRGCAVVRRSQRARRTPRR